MAEYKTPAFLAGNSVDEVHNRAKSVLPADIDVSEGSHAWNFTRPTALVAAEIYEFLAPELLRLIIPGWSYGEYLDAHAKGRHIYRKPATVATGTLTITGAPGTVIPVGSLFSTASVNNEPSVDYVTTEDAEITESGVVEVEVQCTQAGVIGNTGINTIVIPASKITGITGVTNHVPVSGGVEQEDDASLIERVEAFDAAQGESFTGCVADYKRWAMSVPGVGAATVIPANDDTGLVTIIITDSNGAPATLNLCESVYNYIMRPDDEDKRLAPVNAYLSVVPPETLILSVKATIELAFDATMESVQANFMAQLALYIPEALEDKEIKRTKIGAILSSIRGVNDYSDLQIGLVTDNQEVTYGTKNIPITTRQLPIIEAENLILTAGNVF